MNTYIEIKKRHQEEVNKYPIAFAFRKQQFVEAMTKLGLEPTETNKVVSVHGCGDILRKEDVPAYMEMLKRHREEIKDSIDADKTGDGFIFDMFDSELANHEYGFTGDPYDALEELGVTIEDLNKSAKLMFGFRKACKNQMDWYNKHN